MDTATTVAKASTGSHEGDPSRVSPPALPRTHSWAHGHRRALPSPRITAALAALVSASCLLFVPGLARADGPTPAQEAQADALFQRANEKAAKKDYVAACPLFEEAYRIAGGGGTAQNLAICYEDLGKVTAAYNAFVELRRVAIATSRLDRVKLAEEHLAKLEPRLSRLRVRIPSERRVPDLLISVDGDTYGEKALESGIVVDLGSHVVKLTAAGRKPLELTRSVTSEGSTVIVDVPVADPVEPPLRSVTVTDERVVSHAATRTLGLVLGGAGMVTLVAGGVFAVLTVTTNASARRACRDNTDGLTLSNKGLVDDPSLSFDSAGNCYASTPERPNPYVANANRIHDEARGYGTMATFMVPIGLGAVAFGTYLVLSSRPDEAPKELPKKASSTTPPRALSARLVPGIGSVMLSGEFN